MWVLTLGERVEAGVRILFIWYMANMAHIFVQSTIIMSISVVSGLLLVWIVFDLIRESIHIYNFRKKGYISKKF